MPASVQIKPALGFNKRQKGVSARFVFISVMDGDREHGCGARGREGSRESASSVAVDQGTGLRLVKQLLNSEEKWLVERKISLIYGGGSLGLMGLLAREVFNGGCHVLGVIPTTLLPNEISGETIGETKAVFDMHERKSEMAKQADAFIALPGGYGTMEELLEMVAWSQLGIHEKPVGLLNVDGYYDDLLALFDRGVKEGFIESSARHIMVVAQTAGELMGKLEEYTPIHSSVATREVGSRDFLYSTFPVTGEL
ncbi:hypothetical protein HPP92_017646 [Vanilla planifolia]|uniref:Cytokinin riboside 5'-monophosphate phosphoribohydrolase n=1 Tax=Vanilla planifolia TaxID=51239 RepID=A0A835QGH0_VANPL|nr:hypothetical protein HPP92_017646 [Vanilla planifolia]